MKKFLFLIPLLFYASFSNAQAVDSVYRDPDEMAQFTGGKPAMYKWIYENMHYREEIGEDEILYTKIWVTFIVETDGSISNIEVKRPSGSKAYDQEMIRVIETMPAWIPARHAGKPVRSYYDFVSTICFK